MATSLAMFVLCALSGALLVLCVVVSRACRTTYVSSYWLADILKHVDTNHPISISACILYVTVSLVLLCLANITSLVPQQLYHHSRAYVESNTSLVSQWLIALTL